jgi:DNA mismatch repair protein MutS
MVCDGINHTIDELNKENAELYSQIEILKTHILSFTSSTDLNYVSIQRLDKEGFFLSLTKNRFNLIKEKVLGSHIIIENELLLLKDFHIKIQTTSVKISSPFIDNISAKYVHNLRKIIELNKLVFKEKLEEFEKKFATLLEDLVLFIAEVDLTISNIKTAKKYNYVCPKIVKTKDDENFLELIDLRHPIIEANEERGIYVPNDIILGELSLAKNEYKNNVIIKNSNPINMTNNKMQGILLYGINSSGKSSLMKSIGIAVVLAQAGFYVAAKSMRFSIFDSVFTRISGADNIAKGLSSFAVEMLELKNIFNRATKRSLILGDEISHSTETMSGVSIVASSILKLSKLEAIFIFATHLHQLPEIKEIEELKNILALHLSVMYEDEEDKLIFDRKLKYGSGSSMYGLEYAKSLHMDKEFLRVANDIRKKLTDDYSAVERLTHKKSSKYNKDVFVSSCVICGRACDETHHIKEQARANKEGFIEHINQNHKYNLVPLCKEHHKMVHNGTININGFVATSKGLELHYTNIETDK